MNKVKIVCEAGINHNGNIDIAKKLILVASAAGADFIKWQKRTIDLVYTQEELDKPRESPWGTTTREQKMGLEFNLEDYIEIDNLCVSNNIRSFFSPWDVESVIFIKSFNPPFIKVPSALITDFTLLEAVKCTEIPIIISTGMSTREEVDKCVEFLGDRLEYILHCNSQYPTPTVDMNMNHIKVLKECYPNYRIGFSNHHPGILFCAVAVALGAEMVEAHITLNRAMYGTDQPASIETGGIMKLVKYIRDLEMAMGNGEWIVTPGEEVIKKKLRK